MLVDDVITAGTAIRESMDLIQANGASLAGVLIALDRQEKGKGELSAIQEVERDYGAHIIAIIQMSDPSPIWKRNRPSSRSWRRNWPP